MFTTLSTMQALLAQIICACAAIAATATVVRSAVAAKRSDVRLDKTPESFSLTRNMKHEQNHPQQNYWNTRNTLGVSARM